MAAGTVMDEAYRDNEERRRIIAFVEHEPGVLAQVTEALSEAGVNIEDIDGAWRVISASSHCTPATTTRR